jgi:hypothetical protein
LLEKKPSDGKGISDYISTIYWREHLDDISFRERFRKNSGVAYVRQCRQLPTYHFVNNKKRIAHPIKILFCNSCALYTFKNAFPVVAHVLDTLQDDGDDKAGMHLAAILRFEFIIALVVTEYILSNTVALTNFFSFTETRL